MPVDPTAILTAVIAGGVSSLAGFAALISARNTARSQRVTDTNVSRKVDAEAYRVAQALYSESLALAREETRIAREEISATKKLYEQTQKALVETKALYDTAESERKFLQIRVHELERTLSSLRQKLKAQGIDLSKDDHD